MVGFNVSLLLVMLFCEGPGGVLSATLCLAGDFDSQLRHTLRTQVQSAQDPARIVARVLNDVRATLNQRWQGFNMIPYGSLTSGIDTKTSDIDISVHLPNFNLSSASHVLEEIRQLFQKQPTLYSYLYDESKPKFIRSTFIHFPTHREVDLIFHFYKYGEEAVATSKLLKYFFSLDERNLTLARFLKFLFKIHGLTCGRQTLQNYTVYMLLIFYLQQKNMAPPVYVLQKDSKSIFVDNWDVSFNELPYSTTNTENLHQLLSGFFKYYSEFNFEEYIVSPFTGRPIPRSAVDVDSLSSSVPQEHFFNNYFNDTIQQKIRSNLKCTDVCIQAVFALDANNGELVIQEYVIKFKDFVKSVARMFEDLPSDRILRAILVVDEHKEAAISHNNATMNGKNEENCIEVQNTL